MAVESPHLPPYPLQLLHIHINQTMMMIDAINNQSNPMHPLSGNTTADTLLPMYSSPFTNPDPHSDLTHTLPVPRKRSRDSSYIGSFSDTQNLNRSLMEQCGTFMFLGEDISSQIRQQQFEIDQFFTLHAEKLRVGMEEKRRRNSRRLISALEEGITRVFMAKEEEIVKMMKLNYALEEKLNSLSIENQIWRELAQTNEATANALRNNLKQVLEQLVCSGNRITTEREDDAAVAAEDAQSCCESNENDGRMLAEQEQDSGTRLCKGCWKGESCVLLLPCRHLCLCTVCDSSVHICPVCKSSKNISVHVHMS